MLALQSEVGVKYYNVLSLNIVIDDRRVNLEYQFVSTRTKSAAAII